MFNKNSLTREDILINNFFYGYYYDDQHPLDPRTCKTSRKKCKLIISCKNIARDIYNVSLTFLIVRIVTFNYLSDKNDILTFFKI